MVKAPGLFTSRLSTPTSPPTALTTEPAFESCKDQSAIFNQMACISAGPGLGIILLMGTTGSGKSTFISRLKTPETHVDIGHGLSSTNLSPSRLSTLETTDVTFHEAHGTGNRRVLLADTPGFDDTSRLDTDILQSIALPLFEKQNNGNPIIGIIYLHDITNPRLSGSTLKTLKILEQFCGEENYPKIVFATTMWQDAGYAPQGQKAAGRRQDELKRDFWDPMFKSRHGGVLTHLVDGADSAREVVDHLLEELDGLSQSDKERPFQILREMAENGSIEQTSAYRCAREEQDLTVQQQKQDPEELEDEKRRQQTVDGEDIAFSYDGRRKVREIFNDFLMRLRRIYP
ncbi:hypothetical protein OQA88_10263 [Cercophora sp. LCS_1]